MPQLFTIFRILLAVPVCGGLCRLDWGHGREHGTFAECSPIQAIDAEDEEHGDALATLFSEATGLHALPAPANEGAACATLEITTPLIVCAPTAIRESRVSLEMTTASGSRDEGMGNKDPPSTCPA